MSIVERSPRRSRIRLPALGENMALGAVALGFLVLHILAGTLLLPAHADGPATPQEETRSLTD